MTAHEFTTSAFLDWLRDQPKDREFDYWSHDHCICATFAKEGLGWADARAGGVSLDHDGALIMLPRQVLDAFDVIVKGRWETPLIFTAGQLLDKLTT